MMADYRNALDPIDMGGYSPEQAWRGRYRVPQGGVLDTLPDDAPMPSDPVQRNALASYLNQGLGLVNHYAMGIPATMAGLVNAAIPGQPFGDMWSAVQSGRDAADEFAANGRGARDLLSLPDAFAGSVPGGAKHLTSREGGVTKADLRKKGFNTNELVYQGSSEPGRLIADTETHPTPAYWFSPEHGEAQNFAEAFHVPGKGEPVVNSAYIRPGQQWETGFEGMKVSRDPDGVPYYSEKTAKFMDSILGMSDRIGMDSVRFKNMRDLSYEPTDQIAVFDGRNTHFVPEYGIPERNQTNASAYLDLFKEGAAQAGRGIDNALTSAVRAMPDNAVGSAGGKLSAPSPAGIRAYHGSPR